MCHIEYDHKPVPKTYKFSVAYKNSDFGACRCWDKSPQYCFQGLVPYAKWLCRVLQTKSLKCLISFKFHPRQISQQSKPHTHTTTHIPPFNLRQLLVEEKTLAESLESVLLSWSFLEAKQGSVCT